MNVEDAYLAGLIDGEGALSLRRQRRGDIVAELTITNTNPLIQGLLDVSKLYFRKRQHSPNSKPCIYLTVQRHAEILKLLKRVYPYLRLKKEQAELMMEFCESRLRRGKVNYSERELEIQRKLHFLNQKGLSSTPL